jgi:hypothetical protein
MVYGTNFPERKQKPAHTPAFFLFFGAWAKKKA